MHKWQWGIDFTLVGFAQFYEENIGDQSSNFAEYWKWNLLQKYSKVC